MQPVVTPEEMGAIDRAAPEPVEVLIGRAAAAVARAAVRMLGGTYGKRVLVVAGKGNTGNDGREAAGRLRARGVRVVVLDAGDEHHHPPPADLVIDAAYGTGFRGHYRFPAIAASTPVLAVDIPSGVNGLTGEASEGVRPADRTITFAAYKPGLLLGRGRALAGPVEVADIGLDTSSARIGLVDQRDLREWLPERPVESHKWRSATWVVAGSPGMTGAAALATRGAQRAGAGYVRLSTPGIDPATDGVDPAVPVEAVTVALGGRDWAGEVLAGIDRFGSVVVGPGLGRDPGDAEQVRRLVASSPVPVVVDGDGLRALGRAGGGLGAAAATVLTPHDGELAALTGHPPGADRIAEARRLAAGTGAVVLLKGATTVVARADGEVLLVTAGTSRLATAGTGDVLAGMIGALVAQGVDPWRAAAGAAFWHGRASTLGFPRGLVASDLPDLLPHVLHGPEGRA